MDSEGIFLGVPSPRRSGHVTFKPDELRTEASSPELTLQVLSVGRLEHDAIIRQALGQSSKFFISHASDYRELWTLSKEKQFHVAVFHNSLGSFELEEVARLVRSRWPTAKILIIRSGEVQLDDPLYDRRLVPPTDPKELTSALFRLGRSSEEDARHDAA